MYFFQKYINNNISNMYFIDIFYSRCIFKENKKCYKEETF